MFQLAKLTGLEVQEKVNKKYGKGTPQKISKRYTERKDKINIWGCKSISGCNMIKNVPKLSGTHQWITKKKAIPTPKLLIKDHKELASMRDLPTRIVWVLE